MQIKKINVFFSINLLLVCSNLFSAAAPKAKEENDPTTNVTIVKPNYCEEFSKYARERLKQLAKNPQDAAEGAAQKFELESLKRIACSCGHNPLIRRAMKLHAGKK